jgi:hypothetical protein
VANDFYDVVCVNNRSRKRQKVDTQSLLLVRHILCGHFTIRCVRVRALIVRGDVPSEVTHFSPNIQTYITTNMTKTHMDIAPLHEVSHILQKSRGMDYKKNNMSTDKEKGREKETSVTHQQILLH